MGKLTSCQNTLCHVTRRSGVNFDPIFEFLVQVFPISRRNHPCQVSSQSVQQFRLPRGSKCTISHRLGEWLLQQCYALTCYAVIHGKLNKNYLTFIHIKQMDPAFRIGSLKKCLRLSPSQFVQYSTSLLHKATYQTYADRLMSYHRRFHHPNQLTVSLDRYHSLLL